MLLCVFGLGFFLIGRVRFLLVGAVAGCSAGFERAAAELQLAAEHLRKVGSEGISACLVPFFTLCIMKS